MAVTTQMFVLPSCAIQDNKFVLKIQPEQYLATVKTEAALTCETLEETSYPLRYKYPEGYHLRVATFWNGRGCDPSSGHWNISPHDSISEVFSTRAVCCVILRLV